MHRPKCGSPQGGVISPLLSNLYLHMFDKLFHRQGGPAIFANAKIVRYADDFVILAKYQGSRIKEWVEGTLEGRFELKVNQDKTRIVDLNNEGVSLERTLFHDISLCNLLLLNVLRALSSQVIKGMKNGHLVITLRLSKWISLFTFNCCVSGLCHKCCGAVLKVLVFFFFFFRLKNGIASLTMEVVMKITHFLVSAAVACVLATPTMAQDVHVGGQLTVSKPMGDLGASGNLDGKIGYGFGAHCLVGFQGGHAIVPRLDYTMYKRSTPAGSDFKVNALNFGVDYNYFVGGKANEGIYLGAGLGYGSTKFEVSSGVISINDTPTALTVAASVGMIFHKNMGAELRYTTATYEPKVLGVTYETKSPSLNLSFIARM